MNDTQIYSADKKILNSIYGDFFKNRIKTHLDVFLCGKGNNDGKNQTIRDEIRNKFVSDKHIRIIYPEELFIDFFNKNKKYNMLEMEKFLADNADVICIVCENSPGAFVELGAFTNNSSTLPKVIALIPEEHKRDKSFIMLGPIKCIQQQNIDNVLFFSNKIDNLHDALRKVFHTRIRNLRASPSKDIDTIVGQYYYIVLLLFYYKTLTAEKLIKCIKYTADTEGVIFEDFSLLYNAVLKLLYRERLIEKLSHDEEVSYSLSEKGISFYYQFFYNSNKNRKTFLSDRISLSILAAQYY